MGQPSLFGLPGDDWMSALWAGPLAEGGHSVAELRQATRNTIVLPEAEPGGFLDRIAPSGRYDGCPPEVESA